MINSDKGRTKITGSTAEILVDLEYIGEALRGLVESAPKALIINSMITGLYGDIDKEKMEREAKKVIHKRKGDPGFDELMKELRKEE